MTSLEVFWRPPLTSSSQFRKEDRHLAFGLVSPDAQNPAARPIAQIAGWILCEAVQESVPDGNCGLRRETGPPSCDASFKDLLAVESQEPVVFEAFWGGDAMDRALVRRGRLETSAGWTQLASG